MIETQRPFTLQQVNVYRDQYLKFHSQCAHCELSRGCLGLMSSLGSKFEAVFMLNLLSLQETKSQDLLGNLNQKRLAKTSLSPSSNRTLSVQGRKSFYKYGHPLLLSEIIFVHSSRIRSQTIPSKMLIKLVKPNRTLPLTCQVRQLATSTSIPGKLSSLPKAVDVFPEEKLSGKLTWKNLELATRALHHDGIVVLENAISHTKLDFLNEKMVRDARTLQEMGDAGPYNYNKGSVSNPSTPDFLAHSKQWTEQSTATSSKIRRQPKNISIERYSSTYWQHKSHPQF